MMGTHSAGPLHGLRVTMLLASPVTFDARVLREATALADAGADVVIACLVTELQPETVGGIRIRAVAPPSILGANGRRVGALRRRAQLARAWISLATADDPDIIHCHEIFTVWVGMLLSTLRRIAFVYDAHELYPETSGHTRRTIRNWRMLEWAAVRMAWLVIAANDLRSQRMAHTYRTDPPLAIRNVPPLLPQRPAPDPLAAEMRADVAADTLLIYQGALSDTRGLDAVVDAIALLPERYHLALIGNPPPAPQLAARLAVAAEHGRVHVFPPVKPAEMLSWLVVADAGVVTYVPDCLNNSLCAPNKMHDYAAAGLPVLAASLPGVERDLEEYGPGLSFTPCDPESFARAAEQLFTEPGLLERSREGARRMHESLNWPNEAERLVAAYTVLQHRLCARRRRP
ncbi:MAG: glycosyltransferase family 4 protein [Coriobacteriia bacterium]|nr:glycosyltransferase family 4 protein [Coriobacteriia bacterium]